MGVGLGQGSARDCAGRAGCGGGWGVGQGSARDWPGGKEGGRGFAT